jgi:hypothetical protein
MPRTAAPRGAILDPTSDPVDNTVTKIGVDATKPGGADFAERLTIADDQCARVRNILSAAGFDSAQIQRKSRCQTRNSRLSSHNIPLNQLGRLKFAMPRNNVLGTAYQRKRHGAQG